MTFAPGEVQAGRGGARALVRHSLVLAERNVTKIVRTPSALLDVTAQPIIFLVLFTYVFGGAIAGGDRHAYLQQLLPGVLGQSVALGSLALGYNLNRDVSTGVFDRFRSLPIARVAPLVGGVVGDLFRYVVLVVVTLSAGYAFGFRITTGVVPALAGLLLTVAFALCFTWISVLVGVTVKTAGGVQGVMAPLTVLITFGSNVFVPTGSLPGFLQHVVQVNPLSRLVGAVRGLMVGGPVTTDLVWTLGWMAVLLAVFVPLALRAYNRRV